MISLSDLVALAKAGYGPKQVKELIEVFQTDPKVKDAKIETGDQGKPEIKDGPKPDGKNDDPKPAEGGKEDDIAELIKLIKED